MNESTLVPREELSDLDWLARNVHKWPAGDHQPWCYVYMTYGGVMKAAGNFLDAVANPTMITIEQWLTRRAELQNKPSWEDAPMWATELAQDSDGKWFFYADTPTAGQASWCVEGTGDNELNGTGEVLGDWRDTLEKRPEEFQPFTSIEDNQEKAMKQDNGWFERGELPPVGAVCEYVRPKTIRTGDKRSLPQSGEKVTIVAHHQFSLGWAEVAVFAWTEVGEHEERTGRTCTGLSSSFRPVHTERDELVNVFINHYGNPKGAEGYIGIADAILAAGFSMGAK